MPVPPEKAFHELIVINLTVNPDKFLRYYRAKPGDDHFKLAVKAVKEMIEDFGLATLKLEEMPNYALFLRQDPVAEVLLGLAFVDFYLETTTGQNREALTDDTASIRETMADNILTYLTTQMEAHIDHNKLYSWVYEKKAPPSRRPKRRHSDSTMKSTVQPARPNSSTPPAS